MPLVPNTLNVALEQAFDKAMFVFAETIANSPTGTNVADKAREAAAKTFAAIATPAIDTYIKSATVTVPPGQAVLTAFSPAPLPGSTTTPVVAVIA
jgi:hypothetical protein